MAHPAPCVKDAGDARGGLQDCRPTPCNEATSSRSSNGLALSGPRQLLRLAYAVSSGEFACSFDSGSRHRQNSPPMRALLWLLLSLLALGACASRPVQETTRAAQDAPWVCEPDPGGSEWRCQREEN